MITASRLAGVFAAHAVWSVCDGATLIPILAYTTESDERKMERFVGDDQKATVEQARQRLNDNPMDATDAVLIYDGRITFDSGKTDALFLELRSYFSPDSQFVLAIPYTPKDAGGFRVHRPKVLDWENCDDFDLDAAFEEFFAGVEEHEQGAKVWRDALDESR